MSRFAVNGGAYRSRRRRECIKGGSYACELLGSFLHREHQEVGAVLDEPDLSCVAGSDTTVLEVEGLPYPAISSRQAHRL